MEEFNEKEALKLENQLCFPLYAAARQVVSLYTPYLRTLGITYTQYIVFLVLWERDGIPVGELGRRLYLDNGTLTPLLKKMEKEGYITRTRESSDERVVTIRLTDKGLVLSEVDFSVVGIGICTVRFRLWHYSLDGRITYL